MSQFTYTHDANGNITSVNDGQITKNYVYDKLDQLIESHYPNGNTMRYTYDYEGNRIGEVGGSFNLDLDISYSYDLENRLKTVTNKRSTTSMSYHADGMRAKKESSSGYTNYIYNMAGKLVAESENSSSVTSNYVWGPDRVLAKNVAGGAEYYYLYNGHGDVVQMVDRNGNIVNTYEYDEWGNIRFSNETVSNPFKYAGEVYDEETGLYYLGARYYNPAIGRFLNEDAVEGQIDNLLSMNSYVYCYNNPLRYIDPSGNVPIETAADIAFIVVDAGELARQPSLENVIYLTWDVAAALLPYVPGSYVAKGGKVLIKAGNAREKAKAGEKLLKLTKEAKTASETSKGIKMNLQFFAAKGAGKSTLGLLKDIDVVNGKYYASKRVIDEIGKAEAKGVNFSSFKKTIQSTRPSKEGGVSLVIRYSDNKGTSFIIHEVTDSKGKILHRDFDAVRIASGQLINKK